MTTAVTTVETTAETTVETTVETIDVDQEVLEEIVILAHLETTVAEVEMIAAKKDPHPTEEEATAVTITDGTPQTANEVVAAVPVETLRVTSKPVLKLETPRTTDSKKVATLVANDKNECSDFVCN